MAQSATISCNGGGSDGRGRSLKFTDVRIELRLDMVATAGLVAKHWQPVPLALPRAQLPLGVGAVVSTCQRNSWNDRGTLMQSKAFASRAG